MQKTAIKVTEMAFSCYPVKDMDRARRFYENVLNLKCAMNYSNGPNHWVEYQLNGGTFTLGYMEGGPQPTNKGPSIALEVSDFDEAIETLKAEGVKFNMDPIETPGCHMAVIEDSEGNALIIHKLKEGR